MTGHTTGNSEPTSPTQPPESDATTKLTSTAATSPDAGHTTGNSEPTSPTQPPESDATTKLTSTATTSPDTGNSEPTSPTQPPESSATTKMASTATTSPDTVPSSTQTTASPSTPSTPTSTVTTNAPPPTLPPVLGCSPKCPPNSECLDGTCFCISGFVQQNDQCVQAQVFPGDIRITSLTFEEEMKNRSSEIFRKTAQNISNALFEALRHTPGYIRSDVLRLESGSVVATVNNIYENVTDGTDIENAIQDAIANASASDGLLDGAGYRNTELCDQEPKACTLVNTYCVSRTGSPICFCGKDFIPDPLTNDDCFLCPSGMKEVGGQCEKCSFGYAGYNCDDSSELAVVVVSCVLGGLLLIMAVAWLAYCSCRRQTKKTKSRQPENSGTQYFTGKGGQTWTTGVTRIPRAISKWEASPQIEMTEGGGPRALLDTNPQTNGYSGSYDVNPDAMRTFTGKNPSRYSYLVQGHVNPYYLPGDETKN